QPDVTTLPGGFTINEDFDWRGDLTAVTDPNGRRTTYAYNKRRQRTGETADAGGIAAASNSTFDNQARVATAYTRNGRVASVSEPSGDTATFPDGTPPTTSSAQVPASGTLVIDLAPLRGLEAKIGYFQPSEARGAA
ncbi:MAG: RHS repeat domain-containing protein, partial [Terrimicrobiaceae bacterium]